MGDLLKGYNDRRLLLVPRSGSHSLVVAWLQQEEPDNYAAWVADGKYQHPAIYLNDQESSELLPELTELAVVVRNPVERFRSMVAHKEGVTVEQQLAFPMYRPLPRLNFTKHFRFEDQLQAAAEWIGITGTLPVVDPSDPQNRPTLTPEQEARVREIYAADIALWESLP